MKLVWITDIHLDSCSRRHRDRFFSAIEKEAPDWLLVGGDVWNAHMIETFYRTTSERFYKTNIGFVMGNHDFYGGNVYQTRQFITELADSKENLHYLSKCDVIRLTDETCLIGHDSWGDGRYGDPDNTAPALNDYVEIEELRNLLNNGRNALIRGLRSYGDECAAHFERVLPTAMETYKNVVVLVHVPPFEEIAKLDDSQLAMWPNLVSWFGCKALEDILMEIVPQYPDSQVTVYGGHVHHDRDIQPLSNLRVISGAAAYGQPKIQRVLTVE